MDWTQLSGSLHGARSSEVRDPLLSFEKMNILYSLSSVESIQRYSTRCGFFCHSYSDRFSPFISGFFADDSRTGTQLPPVKMRRPDCEFLHSQFLYVICSQKMIKVQFKLEYLRAPSSMLLNKSVNPLIFYSLHPPFQMTPLTDIFLTGHESRAIMPKCKSICLRTPFQG